jgi:hypothetical protein
MHEKDILPPAVQSRFLFAQTQLWTKLPATTRDNCRQLITKLLLTALGSEFERTDNGRQD